MKPPSVFEWAAASWIAGNLSGTYVVRIDDVWSVLDAVGLNDNRLPEKIEARWRLREMLDEEV